MESNENSESVGTEPKIIKKQIEYVLKFDEKGVELVYSPQDDYTHLVALMIAEQTAVRAKENLVNYLKGYDAQAKITVEQADSPRVAKEFNKEFKQLPEYKKAEDRLNWAGKTITGLGIQIQALIEMIAYSNNPDVIKEQRQVMANEMIKKMEAQIQKGETPEGMTITKQQMPEDE